jgi:predicted RNase H-like nuclease (RuvC/YqgF family)
MAGVVCQGQKIQIDIAQVIAKESIRLEKKIEQVNQNLYEGNKYHNRTINELSREVYIFKIKIDSLEKRVKELENNCIAIKTESVPSHWEYVNDTGTLIFHTRETIVPFKEIKK